MAGDDDDPLIFHEVVELTITETVNLARAWRIHLGWSRKEVAKRNGISPAALSQIERTENSHLLSLCQKRLR